MITTAALRVIEVVLSNITLAYQNGNPSDHTNKTYIRKIQIGHDLHENTSDRSVRYCTVTEYICEITTPAVEFRPVSDSSRGPVPVSIIPLSFPSHHSPSIRYSIPTKEVGAYGALRLNAEDKFKTQKSALVTKPRVSISFVMNELSDLFVSMRIHNENNVTGERLAITKFVTEIDTTALEFCKPVINSRLVCLNAGLLQNDVSGRSKFGAHRRETQQIPRQLARSSFIKEAKLLRRARARNKRSNLERIPLAVGRTRRLTIDRATRRQKYGDNVQSRRINVFYIRLDKNPSAGSPISDFATGAIQYQGDALDLRVVLS
ncbi:hypothetical protein EVAR_59092_1 [Eumeta japonica]|uniref:Uncharacterized protein n=1 Tax=Eumeta variegata TaxID=151549 RepID=A0A4C1Z1C8_EUMVA|nr:hypothetical protein EVAR_59092_1 [Eumeta japonica]